MAVKKRDWSKIINRLNENAPASRRIMMGSPGSAQVTRVRLLKEWNNLKATTKGAVLFLEVG